jgi:basic membrane lipoprotein Med (substrate-binding protein (PBP1-ABC) superfamily)
MFWFLLLAFLVSPPQAARADAPMKVGFLFVGPVSDHGWNFEQDKARQKLEANLKGKITTTSAESVYENSDAERVMEKMIAQGAKIIFATSYGYLEPVSREAARHPDVKFMQLSRFENRKNLATYFYLGFQPMYIAGVVAGRTTKTNKIGFVASNPVPPIVQSINAFALGVKSVNPKAHVRVVWTNVWIDPATEVEAAKGLFDTGVDILAFDQSDSLPIVKAAEGHNVKVVGCYSDAHEFAPKNWLTGASLNWAPFYTRVCQYVLDNKWQSGITICSMFDDSVQLSTLGPAVTPTVKKEAEEIAAKIKSGKLTIFQGPVKDNTGKVRLEAGKKPDIHWLSTMDFLVDGVDGSLSKK